MANREPETQAIIKYVLENPFVLGINFHDGSVVASYPFDDIKVIKAKMTSCIKRLRLYLELRLINLGKSS